MSILCREQLSSEQLESNAKQLSCVQLALPGEVDEIAEVAELAKQLSCAQLALPSSYPVYN